MTKRKSRPRRLFWIGVIVLLLGAVGAAFFFLRPRIGEEHRERKASATQDAPADLAKLRGPFLSGVDALQRGDGADAVKHLSGFTFGKRAVEEYRLYLLANAYQLKGDAASARRTLAQLWRRNPRLIYRHDVAFNIASLYASTGSWNEASEVYATLVARANDSAIASEARWNYIESRINAGDPISAFAAARRLVVENPKSRHAAEAIALLRTFVGVPAAAALPMTADERVTRAEHLLSEGDPQNALDELATMDAGAFGSPVRQRILLTRGLALQGVRRFADSDATLAPLTTDQFRFAIPALRASVRNNAVLASSINPVGYKTVTEKKKVGTVKVRVKGKKKLVTKPKYALTKKSVKVINLQLQLKKDDYDRKTLERLKDILDVPVIPIELRKETLTTLIGRAEAKNQDAYMRQLIPQLVKIDRLADAGLQRFWDKAWAAYSAGDLKGARDLLDFVKGTYTNPNIQRQATYWLARIDERTGRKAEAAATFQQIADSTYEDVYALFAEKHGAKRDRSKRARLADSPDWRDVAERSVPAELRLAYELSALGANRESRLEIQDNTREENRKWSDAILAQLFHDEGNAEVAYRLMRRAYPELATIEQQKVPRQFIEMYYPLKYEDWIQQYSKERGLDPYLVMALIRQESSYNPQVKSHVGATGLMQIMPATGNDIARRLHKFGTPRLTDPKTNIELGTYYLKQLIGWVGGSSELALAAYNGGIGNVRKWQASFGGKKPDEFLESIPFTETRGYVKRITMMRSTYEQLHDELKQ